MVEMILEGLEDLLIPLGLCVGLPVMIVWLQVRRSMNETNKRSEIALAAIEKDPNVDVAEFLKKMTPPRKTMQQSLLNKLLCGCIFTLVGLGVIGVTIFGGWTGGYSTDSILRMTIMAVLSLSIGVACLVTYFVGKKMLVKEPES